MTDLNKILMAYGFTQEHQADVIRLLYLAGCFDPEVLQNSLHTAGYADFEIAKIISKIKAAAQNQFQPKILDTLNPELILTEVFTSLPHNPEWREKTHRWLIQETQREFFARKAGQERWQQETGTWLVKYEKEACEIVNRLQLGREIPPQAGCYDAIVIFGATAPEMEKRLHYAKILVDERGVTANYLYLLSGERPANKDIDGGEVHLQEVANFYKIKVEEITETHLLMAAYKKVRQDHDSKFSRLAAIEVIAGKGNKPRPNTVDTLIQLTKTLDKQAKKLLFISRAPYIQAQAEDTWEVLGEICPQVTAEIVGSRSDASLTRIISSLGGALFGGYIRVAMALGSQHSRATLKNMQQALGFAAMQSQSAATTNTSSTTLGMAAANTAGLLFMSNKPSMQKEAPANEEILQLSQLRLT